jgi:hypothetical protein
LQVYVLPVPAPPAARHPDLEAGGTDKAVAAIEDVLGSIETPARSAPDAD